MSWKSPACQGRQEYHECQGTKGAKDTKGSKDINDSKDAKGFKDTIPGQRCTVGTDGIQRISGIFHWNAPETHWKVEALFQSELSRIFSDDFRSFPTGKHMELAGIHRKKVPAGILLSLPVLSCGIR